jgi:uncharacterized alkaline shock family protein YloU
MAHDSIQKERITDLGVMRIHNDVIAAIASTAAGEIKGVHKLGGGLTKNIYDLMTRRTMIKGVRVVSGEHGVRLSLSIIVEYGVDIPRVADEVQENIKRQVEKMTGLVLQEVNVDVEGVHAPVQPKTFRPGPSV